jgi:DNA primase
MGRGYKEECPQCGGENLYVTPDNGMAYCFNCEYRSTSGQDNNVRGDNGLPFQGDDGVIEEIRQLYTDTADYYHACLTPQARSYAHERGITDESIQRYKIGYCPATSPSSSSYSIELRLQAGLVTSSGFPTLGGRLTFPYINPIDSRVVDIRGRAMIDVDPKYKGPFGTTSSRGAGEWPYNAAALKEDHIITEGEIKTIVAQQFGFRAVGLPGIAVWRWRLRSMARGKQVVVFDSQAQSSTRESVYAAIDKLAQKLPNLHVATLPLGKQQKVDLDAYLLTKGPDEFKLILTKALPYNEWANLLRRPYVLRQGR